MRVRSYSRAVIGIGLLVAGCIETGGPPKSNVTFKRAVSDSASSDFDPAPMRTPMRTDAGAGSMSVEGAAALPPTSVSAGGSGAGAQPRAGGASGGAGGVGGAGGAMSAPEPALPAGPVEGTLKVSFTSVDLRGRYSPRNCGAVWIETPSGEFVKTIERWCGFRAYYLERWTEASGGWGGGFSLFGAPSEPSPDQMDAVSSGTLRMIVPHESTWKSRNVDGEVVPDGEYNLVIEVSDGDEASLVVPFTKGHEPLQLMPPDEGPCTGLMVDYQPGAAP